MSDDDDMDEEKERKMTDMTPVQRLSRDIANAAVTLSDAEARFLVDAYYQMQDNRIRQDAQIRSMENEPHSVLSWLAEQSSTLENQIKRALDKYSAAHPVGEWLRDVDGIGPVIAAGLLAHIDIRKAPTAGHIWRFAGVDPTSFWEKGEKRPWNAELKTLLWKAGESFVKRSNVETCVYGRLYKQRKEREVAKNEAGDFASQAAHALERKKYRHETEAYKAYATGKLPPAHIHARARRWAVKIFVSHLHTEMYRRMLHEEPPAPYPIAILGHAHKIEP